MPGRAVDVVLAAVQALGEETYAIEVSYRFHPGIHLALLGLVDEHRARAVYAALGVTCPTLGQPYGSRPQARMSAHVPALGTDLMITVDDLPPSASAPADVEALVAGVDAARAAEASAEADGDLDVPPCTGCGRPPHRELTAQCGVRWLGDTVYPVAEAAQGGEGA